MPTAQQTNELQEPTAQQTNELQEILNILDPDIGHFADKLAKWMFKSC